MPFHRIQITQETARAKIEKAKKLLSEVVSQEKSYFLLMLKNRIDDFETALLEIDDPSERQLIIQQYNRFASALHQCLFQPKDISFYITHYHNFEYHPVGINNNDAVKPNSILKNTAVVTSILGAALIIASLASFAFNPVIAGILLPIGITLLAPSCMMLLTPDPIDTSEKKLEEKLIFQTGAKLIDPNLDFAQDQANEISQYKKAI